MPGKWCGPARALAQDGSSIVCVSHSGRLFRCAPEHIRVLSDSKYHQIPSAEILQRFEQTPAAQTGPFQFFDLSSQQAPASEQTSKKRMKKEEKEEQEEDEDKKEEATHEPCKHSFLEMVGIG